MKYTILHYFRFLFICMLLFCIFYIIKLTIQWENANQIEIWVEYEVKILDDNKVVFYKSHDTSDSLVFRLDSHIFEGTEAIEKLEYRLP